VYVAGYYHDGYNEVGCVWVNGVPQPLGPEGMDWGDRALAIDLTGDGYVVAGYTEPLPFLYQAIYWDEELTRTILTFEPSTAVAIEANGDIVDIAGSVEDGDSLLPVHWQFESGEGPSETVLPAEGYARVYDLVSDGTNVHIVGGDLYYDEEVEKFIFNAIHWQSGLRTVVSSNAELITDATSIARCGDELSIIGFRESWLYTNHEESFITKGDSFSYITLTERRRHVCDHTYDENRALYFCGTHDPENPYHTAWYAYRTGFGYEFVDLFVDEVVPPESAARAIAVRMVEGGAP
jgi:hypothetical protein